MDEPLPLREIIFRLLCAALAAWTLWLLGVGWWQVHQITTDDTGRLALLASPYFRDSAEVQHAFYLTWADPAARAAWIEDFSSSFWGARVQLWGIPAIAGGILALLVRPRNQA